MNKLVLLDLWLWEGRGQIPENDKNHHTFYISYKFCFGAKIVFDVVYSI